MKAIVKLLCLMLVCLGLAEAQTEKLTGNKLQIPNASNFNGYLRIKLTGSRLQNICSTPFKPVPTMFATYPIVNGIVTGLSGANFLSQDCMSPRIPYYVEVADTNNIVKGSDNWYIPRTVSGSVDIGNMQEQHFGGPITVAIPYGIISTPSVSQSITQPAGTSFTFYGIVNFAGTANFANPVAFNIVDANQVLIGGITSSTFALDVQGGINTSAGYYYGGSGGTAGQCLKSDGVSFKPGNCSTAFPTMYYQVMQNQSTSAPQMPYLDTSARFTLATESTTQTLLDLRPVGTPGTYTNVASMTIDQWGRVAAATSGAASSTNLNQCPVSRGLNYTYQNTTGSTQFVYVTGVHPGSYSQGWGLIAHVGASTGSMTLASENGVSNDQGQRTLNFIVPNGFFYTVTVDFTYVSNPQTPSIVSWINYQYAAC